MATATSKKPRAQRPASSAAGSAGGGCDRIKGFIFQTAAERKSISLPRWAIDEIGDELRELAAMLDCLPQLQRGVMVMDAIRHATASITRADAVPQMASGGRRATRGQRASEGELDAADRIGRVAKRLRLPAASTGAAVHGSPNLSDAVEVVAAAVRHRIGRIAVLLSAITE